MKHSLDKARDEGMFPHREAITKRERRRNDGLIEPNRPKGKIVKDDVQIEEIESCRARRKSRKLRQMSS